MRETTESLPLVAAEESFSTVKDRPDSPTSLVCRRYEPQYTMLPTPPAEPGWSDAHASFSHVDSSRTRYDDGAHLRDLRGVVRPRAPLRLPTIGKALLARHETTRLRVLATIVLAAGIAVGATLLAQRAHEYVTTPTIQPCVR